jgi:hypothetical protein
VDGDPFGQTPLTVAVAAGALQALMPLDLPDGLVSRQQVPAVVVPQRRSLQQLAARLGRQVGLLR